MLLRKTIRFPVGLLLIFLFLFVPQVHAEDKLVGIKAIEQLDQLPYFKTGVRAKQVSSYDRNGGNEDGFLGYYSSLYRDSTGFVIFDEIGPGAVYLIWFTAHRQELIDMGNIRFYFDNETNPRINMKVTDFFSGVKSPFLFPFVGNDNIVNNYNSIGGIYSYLPLPFARSLKISISSATPRFYHITYHLYTDSQGVTSYTGNEDYSRAKQIWNNVGTDPKNTSGNLLLKGTKSIASGQTVSLGQIDGAGVIQSLKIRPSPFSEAALNNAKLKIYWDGQTTAAVDAGIGPFFGSSFGQVDFNSLMLGMSNSGFYYSYFPMPFWSQAKIQIENKTGSALALNYEIQYKKTAYTANAGYFHAQYKQATPTSDGDYRVLETTGQGHFVGITASLRGQGLLFLEGDEKVYVDNNQTMSLPGTGTEDYFNSGWYFKNGPFNLPSHGNPKKGYADIVAYRLHLTDCLPFTQAIRFGLEHGPTNSYNANYYTVAYFYKKDRPSLVLADELNVKNAASEASHQYSASNQKTAEGGAFSYDDGSSLSDDGRAFSGEAQFRVTIPAENQGIRLTRRMDFKTANQKAKVYVDGVLVGTWYSAGDNPHQRWRNEIFEIPASYTQGKTKLNLKIQAVGEWNEYYYWISAHLPPPSAGPTATPTPAVSPQGDFNQDLHVNLIDYVMLTKKYGGIDPLYDLDQSGLVDEGDYQIFIQNYGI